MSSAENSSTLRLWSINGDLLAERVLNYRVLSLVFTHAPAGQGLNVLFGGTNDGRIIRLSSWDLSDLGEPLSVHHAPVTAVQVKSDNTALYSGDGKGTVLTWKRKGNRTRSNLTSFTSA